MSEADLATEVFAYLRVSGRGQLSGDGFSRQRTAIQAYDAANGLTVVEWFEERGVTGRASAGLVQNAAEYEPPAHHPDRTPGPAGA